MKKKLLLTLSVLLMGLQLVWAQSVSIRGKILDEKGEGLPGATIRVKGTNKGTVSDVNGHFKLNTEEGSALVISAIGMKTTEKSAQDGMVVSMKEDTKSLRDVVVTALGIKKDKRTLGYAQTSVKNEVITQGQNGNAVTALSGKVAGLQITNASGTPGAAAFIQLRGINSINLNTQPLFVVDGVPISTASSSFGNPDDAQNVYLNNISGGFRGLDINPDDIEDVSVLKGPGATAIYGSDGANGVILITTKKGAKGGKRGVQVEYSGSITADKVNRLPELQNMYSQGMSGKYQGPHTGRRESWGAMVDTMYWDGASDYPWDKNGNLVGESNPDAKNKFVPYDNAGQFFRTGMTYRHNLSISNGTEHATYRVSLGNLNQNGIIPNTFLKRNTIGLNVDIKPRENLMMGAVVNYANTRGRYSQQGSNLAGIMLGLMRSPINFDNSNGLDDPKAQEAYLFEDGSMRSYRGYGIYDNPYYTINENQYNDETNRAYGNVYATWSPLSWLSFTNRLGTDYYGTNSQQNFGTQTIEIPVVGRIAKRNESYNHVYNDFLINITPYINKEVELSFLLGQNTYSEKYKEHYTQGDNLIIDRWYNINNAQNVSSRDISDSKYRRLSEFGEAKIGINNYLFFGATGRLEHATSYWPNFKPNFYYSLNSSFIFSDAFGISNKQFSYGKFRMSYATAGQNPPVQSTMTRFIPTSVQDGWTNGNGNPINGSATMFESSILFNDDLRPEKTATFEVGTELRFLNNRLGLDYTFYNSRTKDLFVRVPVPASSGNTRLFTNAATINNRGHELQLTINPIRKRDFRWDVIVNYSRNRSKVIKLADGVETVQLNGFTGSTVNLFVDKPYGIFYGSSYVRDADGNIVINDDPTSPYFGMPDVANEQTDLGSVMPDWLGGINNIFTYKGISLGFLFETRQGGVIWNGTRGALTHFGMAKATEGRDKDTKVFDGLMGHVGADGKIYHYDELGNEVLGSGKVNTNSVNLDQTYYMSVGGGFTINEPFVEDASWVRLRELSLSYNLPSKWLKETKFIKGVQFGVLGRNLLLWTKYQGVDPETSLVGGEKAQGLDYFNNPGTKTYGINFKLTF
ncbi:MAG: SusC/RagA family TonB-linked outer membrane protein [Chitinophagaceae bacterium]